MVWGHFAGDRQPARLGLCDEFDLLAAADMAKMYGTVEGGCETDTDGDALLLGVHGDDLVHGPGLKTSAQGTEILDPKWAKCVVQVNFQGD